MIEGHGDVSDAILTYPRKERTKNPAGDPILAARGLSLGRAEVGAKEFIRTVDEVDLQRVSVSDAPLRSEAGDELRVAQPRAARDQK